MRKYSEEVEEKMKFHFAQLSERDKRHYAAVESAKLGYGGKKYIGELFNISQERLRSGEKELANPVLFNQVPPDKQRRPGGGRKKN
jgi:hypothetical protein